MSQSLSPTSDISQIGLINELGNPSPLWPSLRPDSGLHISNSVPLNHVEAKFGTDVATFDRVNIENIQAFLTYSSSSIYKTTILLEDNSGLIIASGTTEAKGSVQPFLDYNKNDASQFDLSQIFILFSIDGIPSSGTSIIDNIEISKFLIDVNTINEDGTRRSGNCKSCVPLDPCGENIDPSSERLYFHNLDNNSIDTSGNCLPVVFSDNDFEYYGGRVIHKQVGQNIVFGTATANLGNKHLITYVDQTFLPEDVVHTFPPPTFFLNEIVNDALPPPSQLVLSTTNRASTDRSFHLNSIYTGPDPPPLELQGLATTPEFHELYFNFLHTDSSGNQFYFDEHYLLDHYPSPGETCGSSTSGICDPDVALLEDVITGFDAAGFGGEEKTVFLLGHHDYHTHIINMTLSAKVNLWAASSNGKHHDNTGGYNINDGVGLFFRNPEGSGVAFLIKDGMPLSSGILGTIDQNNNFTNLNLTIVSSLGEDVPFKDSDELTLTITESTSYVPSFQISHFIQTSGVPINLPARHMNIERGEYTATINLNGRCLHDGENAVVIIPSGIFSGESPPVEAGVCGFGGFQADDFCVSFSHIRQHLPLFRDSVFALKSGVTERINTPPPPSFEIIGCFK